MFNDPFFRRMAIAISILILALVIFSAVLQTNAQGGYIVTNVMPVPGMVEMDTKFYYIANNSGVTEEWILNVAGFVVWSDPTRSPDYLMLRWDNLYPVDDFIDPVARYPQYKPGILPSWTPTEELPFPTWFIWNDATLRVYVFDGLPLE